MVTSFGPIALAGHMQQDLVGSRRWISKEHYVEGLASRSSAEPPTRRTDALGGVHPALEMLGKVSQHVGHPRWRSR